MLYRFLLTVFGYKYNKSFIHNSLRMKLFCWTAMRCGISHLIFSLCAIWVVVCSAFLSYRTARVFFTELCELYSSRMRYVKFDRGDVMRSRNGWSLKVTFQSSPPAVSRGITGCRPVIGGEEQTRYTGKYYPPPLCFA